MQRRRVLTLALALAATATALAAAGVARSATLPHPDATAAARAMGACLRAKGWAVTVKDLHPNGGGGTVVARAPRKLAGYPGNPYLSASFYWIYPNHWMPVQHTELRLRLNAAEARTVAGCYARAAARR